SSPRPVPSIDGEACRVTRVLSSRARVTDADPHEEWILARVSRARWGDDVWLHRIGQPHVHDVRNAGRRGDGVPEAAGDLWLGQALVIAVCDQGHRLMLPIVQGILGESCILAYKADLVRDLPRLNITTRLCISRGGGFRVVGGALLRVERTEL